MAEIVIENNFCIGRGAGGEIALREGSDRIAAKVITEAHNLARTPAEAEKAGYSTSETYLYSPISESSPTVGHGTNLTSFCSGPLALLCQDTSYAGAREPLARPSTGNWDIGAYQAGGEPASHRDEHGEEEQTSPGETGSQTQTGASEGTGPQASDAAVVAGAPGGVTAAKRTALRFTIGASHAVARHGRLRINVGCTGGHAGEACRGLISVQVDYRKREYRRIRGRWRLVAVPISVMVARAWATLLTGRRVAGFSPDPSSKRPVGQKPPSLGLCSGEC